MLQRPKLFKFKLSFETNKSVFLEAPLLDCLSKFCWKNCYFSKKNDSLFSLLSFFFKKRIFFFIFLNDQFRLTIVFVLNDTLFHENFCSIWKMLFAQKNDAHLYNWISTSANVHLQMCIWFQIIYTSYPNSVKLS